MTDTETFGRQTNLNETNGNANNAAQRNEHQFVA